MNETVAAAVSDRQRLSELVEAVCEHRRNAMVVCSDELRLESIGVQLARALRQAPDVRMELYLPSSTDSLLARFNAILTDLPLQAARTPVQAHGVLRVWVLHLTQAQELPEVQVLLRLAQSFPGAGVRLLLLLSREVADGSLAGLLGGRMHRWWVDDEAAASASNSNPNAPTASATLKSNFKSNLNPALHPDDGAAGNWLDAVQADQASARAERAARLRRQEAASLGRKGSGSGSVSGSVSGSGRAAMRRADPVGTAVDAQESPTRWHRRIGTRVIAWMRAAVGDRLSAVVGAMMKPRTGRGRRSDLRPAGASRLPAASRTALVLLGATAVAVVAAWGGAWFKGRTGQTSAAAPRASASPASPASPAPSATAAPAAANAGAATPATGTTSTTSAVPPATTVRSVPEVVEYVDRSGRPGMPSVGAAMTATVTR